MHPQIQSSLRSLVRGEAPWPLYLWGTAGTGKTSAALVALDHCGKRKGEKFDVTPLSLRDWWYGYAEVRQLTGMRVQADKGWHRDFLAVGWGLSTWEHLIARWARLPLVVIDELGVGRTESDFRLDVMLEVINARCNDPVRPVIFTGNVKPSELQHVYDDRVASRILAGTVVHITGEDRRLKK